MRLADFIKMSELVERILASMGRFLHQLNLEIRKITRKLELLYLMSLKENNQQFLIEHS